MSELTPVDIERRLIGLVGELTRAQRLLAETRDSEVDAELAYAAARRQAAGKAPRVTRGSVTVDERAEWIESQPEVVTAHAACRRAQVRREKARDYLTVVRDQAEIVRSLGASVRTAYSLAGVGAP